MECRWQIENDAYAVRVLEKHWPHVKRYTDIREVEWEGVEPVDLICAGFPCQDVSVAGRRAGIEGERTGLWTEVVRCFRAIRPRLILLENVPGLLSLGFGRVLGDLAEGGYDTEWDCIPAAAVGAPHLRYRVFVVAHDHATRDGRSERDVRTGRDAPVVRGEVLANANGRQGDAFRQRLRHESEASSSHVADAAGGRFRRFFESREQERETTPGRRSPNGGQVLAHSKEQSNRRGRQSREDADRVSWWATEPDVGRVAHGVPSRVDRLKCLGNAVVPQVAEWIGRRIMEATQ